jgi:hypothetical protein
VLPGFRPRWTVRRGIEQLYEADARYGLTYDQFTGPSYLRIKRVQQLQDAGRLDDQLRWRQPVATAPIRVSCARGNSASAADV